MTKPKPLSIHQRGALNQLKLTPKIAMSASLDERYRYAWFPKAPGIQLNGKTVDSLERRGFIRVVRRDEPEYDWRWATYVPICPTCGPDPRDLSNAQGDEVIYPCPDPLHRG